MSFLQDLFGDHQQQQGYQDFVNRYEQGPPQEGYTNQEVADRLGCGLRSVERKLGRIRKAWEREVA